MATLDSLQTEDVVFYLRTQWGEEAEGSFRIWLGSSISYSFPTGSFSSGNNEEDGFVPMQADQLRYARLAFEIWDELIAIDLNEAMGDPDAQITFAYSSTTVDNGTYAFGNLGSDISEIPGIRLYEIEAQQLWLSTDPGAWPLQQSGAIRSWNRAFEAVFLHEIGHALGLSHVGSYNATVEPDQREFLYDNRQYSVMSYFGGYNGTDWEEFDATRYGASTPMVFDILVIQMMYGADMTTRVGNTVYGFNSTADLNYVDADSVTRDIFDFADYVVGTFDFDNYYPGSNGILGDNDFTEVAPPIFTIWDAGGHDTLDASLYAVDQEIDLRPGSYSKIGGFGADINASTGQVGGNIGIAFGVVIEDAIGGSANDTIIGNQADNLLRGGAGDDVIFGGGGSDTLQGEGGNDQLSGGNVFADLLDGGDGDDTLDGGSTLVGVSTLTGGAGDDTFIYSSGYLAAVITDFTEDDILDLSGSEIVHSFSELLAVAAQDGADTVFDFGPRAANGAHDILRLQNLNLDDLDPATIRFSENTAQMPGDFLLRANHTSPGFPLRVVTVPLNDGGFVTIEGSADQFTGTPLIGRRYSDRGAFVESFEINTTPHGGARQDFPFVGDFRAVTLVGGGFAVVWNSGDEDVPSIRARVFDGDGNPKGPDFKVNDSDPVFQPGSQHAYNFRLTHVEASVGGGFIVDWFSDIVPGPASFDGHIFRKGFNADGNAVASETDVGFIEGYDPTGEFNNFAGRDLVVAGQTLRVWQEQLDYVYPGPVYTDAHAYVRNLTHPGPVIQLDLSDGGYIPAFNNNAYPAVSVADLTNGRIAFTWSAGSFYHSSVYVGAYTGIQALILDNDLDGFMLPGTDASELLRGGTGNDTLYGLGGDDTLVGAQSNDILDGGDGIDTADYDASLQAVQINLTQPFQTSDGHGVGDQLISIENLRGSAYGDTLTGDANANLIEGGYGDDTIVGGGGADTLHGGRGDDTLIDTGTDFSFLYGGRGQDTIHLNGENAHGFGNEDADLLFVSGSENWAFGGQGDDIIAISGSGNFIGGDDGDDTLFFVPGADATGNSLFGGAGNDTLNAEDIDASGNWLNGGSGNDSIIGGGGIDHIDGGEDNDTLAGGAGADVFIWTDGGGVDTIEDFSVEEGDTIDLSGATGIVGFGDLAFTQTGANTRIDFAGGAILLLEFDMNLLTPSVFGLASQPPSIPGGPVAIYDVTENNAFVVDINATDAEDSEGAGLVYSLLAPELGGAADAPYFTIDAQTGVLGFLVAPDYESTAHLPVYFVTVVVRDSSGEAASQLVTVNVVDVTAGDVQSLGDDGETVTYSAGAGFDQIVGGAGVDTLLIESFGNDVTITTDGARLFFDVDNDGEIDLTVSGIENLVLHGASVSLTGDFSGTGLAPNTIYYHGDAGPNLLDASGMSSSESIVADGLGGNDTLIGGPGVDTLVLDGVVRDYTITFDPVADIYTIAGPDFATGTDQVKGFERLQFQNWEGTIAEFLARPKELGGESILNSTSYGIQTEPGAVALAGGGFLAFWTSYDPGDGDVSTIRARVFDHASNPVGRDFIVNTAGVGGEAAPVAAMLADGSVVIAWYVNHEDGTSSIRARMFDETGTPDGDEFVVSDGAFASNGFVDVAGLSTGGFAISWFSVDPETGDSAAFVRKFDENGSSVEFEFEAAGQTEPQIAGLPGGGFVLVWNAFVGETAQILAQIFDATGNASDAAFVVNETLGGSAFEPTVTSLSGNRFAVAWYGTDENGYSRIHARVHSATGEPLGTEIVLQEAQEENQFDPSLIELTDGSLVIVWTSMFIGDGHEWGIHAQHFDSSGNQLADRYVVNTATKGIQSLPGLTALDGGRYLVTWISADPGDGSPDTVRGIVTDGFTGVVVTGGDGAEDITGSPFGDLLSGGGGADVIRGGLGNDTIRGGDGLDTADYSDAAGAVTVRLSTIQTQDTGSAGIDILHKIERLVGSDYGDSLIGSARQDSIYGGLGDDSINGNQEDDLLSGGAGLDTLRGGDGNDTLIGGADRDILVGGTGEDTFVFAAVSDSARGVDTRDTIRDFEGAGVAGGDMIDLSALNSGMVALSYYDDGKFHGGAGDVRTYQTAGGNTFVEVDVNGDKQADLQIVLTGLHVITQDDLIL